MSENAVSLYPLVSSGGKNYRLVVGENGKEVREYESGAVQDPETGKMLKPLITRANAVQYATHKHVQTQEKMRDAVVVKAREKGWIGEGDGASEAIAYAAAELYADAVDKDGDHKLHERQKVVDWVSKKSGMAPDPANKGVELEDSEGNKLKLGSLEELEYALEYFRSLKEGKGE